MVIKIISMQNKTDLIKSKKIGIRGYVQGDETQIVNVLDICGLLDSPNRSFWHWKHTYRPGFMPWNVQVAQSDKKITGCFHVAILPLKIEDKIEINFCFGGDFALLPESRGQGLPRKAMAVLDGYALEKKVLFRGGFSNMDLFEKVYKQFGDVLIPTVNTEYSKILRIRPLQKKVKEMGTKILTRPAIKKALLQTPLVVNLNINNFPSCHLICSGQGLLLDSGHSDNYHLLVSMPYRLLVDMARGKRTLLKSMLAGSINRSFRIKGLLKNFTWLFSLFWRVIFFH